MPTYQTNVPTGTVPLNQDYLNLQGNFQQLNIAYGVDHVPFSDTSGIPPGGISGMHTALHLVPQAAPAALTGYGQLFSTTVNSINNDQTLFFLTGGNRLLQLTRNFVPVANFNGYTFLPGGLMVQWGQVTGLGGAWPTTEQTLTYATANIAFPTAGYVVFTTFIGPTSGSSGDITINASNPTNFKWQFSGSSSASYGGFYWLAIGV